MAAVRIVVSGIVQGVGYRYWTKATAEQLGLVGWVRNLDDGRVQIHAEGTGTDALVERCYEGPRYAEVTGVSVSGATVIGATAFDVRPTVALTSSE